MAAEVDSARPPPLGPPAVDHRVPSRISLIARKTRNGIASRMRARKPRWRSRRRAAVHPRGVGRGGHRVDRVLVDGNCCARRRSSSGSCRIGRARVLELVSGRSRAVPEAGVGGKGLVPTRTRCGHRCRSRRSTERRCGRPPYGELAGSFWLTRSRPAAAAMRRRAAPGRTAGGVASPPRARRAPRPWGHSIVPQMRIRPRNCAVMRYHTATASARDVRGLARDSEVKSVGRHRRSHRDATGRRV